MAIASIRTVGFLIMVFWMMVRTRGIVVKHWFHRAAPSFYATPRLTYSVARHETASSARPTWPRAPYPGTSKRLHSSTVNDIDSYTSWDQEEEEDESSGSNVLSEEYNLWTNAVQKAIKALEKKQISLQTEWDKAQSVEQTQARAQLIVANLYLFPTPEIREATVQDWENDGKEVLLKLDPQYESASAEAEALFERARKLKRGSKVIQELLQETQRSLEILQDAQLDLASACDNDGSIVEEGRFRLVQDRLQRTAKLTKFQLPTTESCSKHSRNKQQQQQRQSSPYSNIRKLTSPGGCPVLVGRNRRGNEFLSFQIARGNDIWMHSRGCPGAHVLIQCRRGNPEPTEACWQFAANLAVFYSDNRTEQKAQVTAAEPKHLLKPRGAPMGALKLREELRVLVGRPDDVPEFLKLARDESGQSDEYRTSDKAKHRRYTQNVAKQNQAKRRAEQKAKRKRRNRDT